MTIDDYLKNPCRMTSIPLWKSRQISIPDSIQIVHDDDYDVRFWDSHSDSIYFRLMHTLQNVRAVDLPGPFIFSTASVEEYAAHITACYTDISITAETLAIYTRHPVYCPDLWLCIRDARSGMIVASGIGELDTEISEGILEWIQVSAPYRGIGLGTCVVQELLRRMQGSAAFATVSGRRDDPSNPEALYRKCGFTGSDVWHILKKR